MLAIAPIMLLGQSIRVWGLGFRSIPTRVFCLRFRLQSWRLLAFQGVDYATLVHYFYVLKTSAGKSHISKPKPKLRPN